MSVPTLKGLMAMQAGQVTVDKIFIEMQRGVAEDIWHIFNSANSDQVIKDSLRALKVNPAKNVSLKFEHQGALKGVNGEQRSPENAMALFISKVVGGNAVYPLGEFSV